jgi:hypothetical protein
LAQYSPSANRSTRPRFNESRLATRTRTARPGSSLPRVFGLSRASLQRKDDSPDSFGDPRSIKVSTAVVPLPTPSWYNVGSKSNLGRNQAEPHSA